MINLANIATFYVRRFLRLTFRYFLIFFAVSSFQSSKVWHNALFTVAHS